MNKRLLAFSLIVVLSFLFPGGTIGSGERNLDPLQGSETIGSEIEDQPDVDGILQGANFFTENRGQFHDESVLFYTSGGGIGSGFRENGISVSLFGSDGGYSYQMDFAGGSSSGPYGLDGMGHKSNFFIGSDPDLWFVDVPNFERIAYLEVWDGIDILYRTEDGMLKYDIMVRPGAEVRDIGFGFEGAGLEILNDDLVITTPVGNVVDDAPVSFQDGVEVETWWELDEKGLATFGIGQYDTSKTLVIDPGLRFSSYVGGSNFDRGRSIAVDSQGYIFITGYTASNDFPTTTGAFDTGFNGGSNGDAFVIKVNISGDTLIYCTYLGGSQNDYGQGIDIDSQGNAYVCGQTFSNNFPSQSGYDTTYSNGGDVFVTKLSSSGNSLTFSTYLGGWAEDGANDIKVVDRYSYVTGVTAYVNTGWPDQWKYPVTSGAYDRVHNGGDDVFVTKLSQNGRSLSYSTLIGSGQDEEGFSIAVDSSGSAFVAGSTTSSGFPTTSGAYDTSYGGSEDGFALRLSNSGNSLTYSSFLGGTGYDRGNGIAIDSQNRAYVAGETGSSNFPTTTDAYDTTYGGSNDAFLSVFSSSGASLLNSTFIGGSGQDVGRAVFITSSGEAHVTGETYSNNFPTTSGPISSSRAGGSDIFISKIDIGGTGMLYSSYLGGSNNDEGMDVYVDSLGFIYLTGETASSDFPTTYVAFDRTHNSNDDVFFTKFYPADFSPSGLAAKTGYFYVNLTWNPPTTPIVSTYPVVGYNIYRGLSQTRLALISSIGNTVYFNDTINDFTSKTYYYFVSAILQTLGESGESNMASGTPMVTPYPLDPVPVPGDLYVNLTWTTIDQTYLDLFDVDYNIYRGLTPSFLSKVATVGEKGFYNDTDIPPRPSTFYYMISYKVGGVGESNTTNIVQGIPNTPPGEPEGLALVGLDRIMNVSWQPPAKDGGYPIEDYSLYKGLSPGSISHLADLDPGTTTYFDDEVVPGTTYFYTVASSNQLGVSGQTDPIEGIGQTVPSPPKDLNLVPMDQRISIEWKAPEYDWGVPITGYELYKGMEGEELALYKDLGSGTRAFTDTVVNGVTYQYAVTASNIHGESEQAGPLEGMATGIPGVVMNVTFEIGDSSVKLSWLPPASDGGLPITSYRVYRGLEIDTFDMEFVLSSGARTFTDNNLENGVTYYYKVSASNRKGEGAKSAAVIATPGRVAARITQLNVVGGLESAVITWTAPTDLGGREGVNINIYRGASISSLAPIDMVPFTTSSYTDHGLIAGNVYYYSLTVINPLGESPRSPAVSSIVFGKPSSPMIKDIFLDSHSLNITWEPPEDDGGVPLTGYMVDIRQEGDLDWEEVMERDVYHEFFGLTLGVTYDLRVIAINTFSEGNPTEIVKVLVGDPPNEPREFKVDSLKPEIRVKWEPPYTLTALSVLGYNIYMSVKGGEPFLYRVVEPDVREIIIDNVIQGEEYSFSVSAFNIIGEGKATNFRSVISTSSPEPVPLVWISDIGDTMVEISWLPPIFDGGSEITGYTLFKGTTAEAPNQLATAVQGLKYVDNDVINGRTYYYRVRAENGENSEKSYPVEARPAGSPRVPQVFEADAKTDHVTLTWIAPSKDGGDVVTGYILSRGGSLEDLTIIAHLSRNETEYVDRDVSSGKYIYRLEAENDNGVGVPADINVDVPSRTLFTILSGAIGFILPLIIIILVLFLPGYLRKRRDIKERKMKEDEEEELRIRRMRAEEMASRGLPGRVSGAGLGGRTPHPGMAAPPPIHDLPPVQEPVGEDKGYIRPKEMKRERRDKKKVLRADGKSLEHREREEDLRHSLRSKDTHKGKQWEEDRKKALEEESKRIFTGQQFDEGLSAPVPEGGIEDLVDDGIVPTVEDVMKEMPTWEDGKPGGGKLEFDEDIPTWSEDEEVEETMEDIPLAKIPEVHPGVAEDIEEIDEMDEMEELEDLEELEELEDYEE